MDAYDCVMTRRSIRKYEDKKVPDEVIHQLLEAAMSAPSAANKQPWQFIVVKDRAMLEKITKIHEYAQMCKGAYAAILVCGDMKINYKDFWVQDCSAATMNILTAAHALGLGAVWCGIYPIEKKVADIQELFEMPKDIIPLSLIPFGYPAQPSTRVDRFKKERVHDEKW